MRNPREKLERGVGGNASDTSPENCTPTHCPKPSLEERRAAARALVLAHGNALPARVLRRKILAMGVHRNTAAGDVEALLGEPGFYLEGKLVRYRSSSA